MPSRQLYGQFTHTSSTAEGTTRPKQSNITYPHTHLKNRQKNHKTNTVQYHLSNTDIDVVFHRCHTCWIRYLNKGSLKIDVELWCGSHGLDIVVKPRGWVGDKWSWRLTRWCILFMSNWSWSWTKEIKMWRFSCNSK